MARAGDVAAERSLSSWFRRRRDRLLRAVVLAERGARAGPFRLLDIGGDAIYWRRVGAKFLATHHIEVTCIGPLASAIVLPGVQHRIGDGRALPYEDMSFDLVHANSVIEHVGRVADMARFAGEVRRLAPAYYVQTPDFWFPFDPHFYRVPFFHWLPQPMRAALLRRWRIGLHPPQPDLIKAHALAEYAVPLDRTLLRALFPDARLVAERVLGLPKSWIALRTTEQQAVRVEKAVDAAAREDADRARARR